MLLGLSVSLAMILFGIACFCAGLAAGCWATAAWLAREEMNLVGKLFLLAAIITVAIIVLIVLLSGD